ncbi:MAG: helix-turn-helix domain-containing protein [Cyclobacteriaceae bacterium]
MTRTKTRRLAAIMFTDIVGYTAMMQADESKAIAARAKHRQTFEQCHTDHHGDILQYYGDGTLSIFQSGVEAVQCAIAIQKSLSGNNAVPVRIGIHIGDIITDGTEVYGDGVNVASRVENLSTAGAVLISGKLNEELTNQPQITTVALGRFDFKNVAVPMEIFAVANEGINVPSAEHLKGKQSTSQFTVAVLPFVNMSADQESEYFSDGITEEIINALAKIKRLKVTSRTSSFYFKGKNLPIRQIGKELNVAIILEGSIRLSGHRMRLTAQLIDVADDFHFWSETFDRTIDDIFAVQDEISLLIADKLREHVGHFDISEQLVEPSPIKLDVYQQYLKGRYHILKMSRIEIEKGLKLMEEVVATQPNYALGHLGMHFGHIMYMALGLEPAQEAFAKGYPYLQQAIALDEHLPECQLQLSYISLLQDWDLKSTYEHLAKAFDIRPSVEYYQSMASTLSAEGKSKAAGEYIDTALQLDPYSPINYHLRGFVYYIQAQYDQAIVWFEKSHQVKSKFVVSTLYLGQAMLLSGRKQEALDYFQNLTEEHAADLTQVGGVTVAYAMMGKSELAQPGIDQLEAALDSALMDKALELLIMIYAQLGNEQRALELISQGIETRLPMMTFLRHEPLLQPLSPNPQFKELMDQVFGATATNQTRERKYKKSLLDQDLLSKTKHQLDALMLEEQPYLNAQLSLRDLAEMLALSPNQLSQLLNEGFDKNFSEFVNGYRLEEFKSKVADEKMQHLTLLALAYDSGFNSKTVFNTFFKKTIGMTPKAYLKSVRSGSNPPRV